MVYIQKFVIRLVHITPTSFRLVLHQFTVNRIWHWDKSNWFEYYNYSTFVNIMTVWCLILELYPDTMATNVVSRKQKITLYDCQIWGGLFLAMLSLIRHWFKSKKFSKFSAKTKWKCVGLKSMPNIYFNLSEFSWCLSNG